MLCDSPQVMCEQAPIGACCGAEDMAPCEDIDREKCLDNGGQWYDGVSCDDPSEIFECPVQVGCCLEQGDCIEMRRGRCEALTGGTVAGDSCETDEGPVTCPDLTGPQGGCCLPDGSCTYMGEEACADVNGQWLGEDEPCPEDAGATGTNSSRNIISTGNDLYNIGDFNELPSVPVWPHNDSISTAFIMFEWMAANEFHPLFGKYYFQDDPTFMFSAADQTAPDWDCARSELGTKLQRTLFISVEQPSGPDLRLAQFCASKIRIIGTFGFTLLRESAYATIWHDRSGSRNRDL